MTTGALSQNVGKLFSKLKLVTETFLYAAAANWEATESTAGMNTSLIDILPEQFNRPIFITASLALLSSEKKTLYI